MRAEEGLKNEAIHCCLELKREDDAWYKLSSSGDLDEV